MKGRRGTRQEEARFSCGSQADISGSRVHSNCTRFTLLFNFIYGLGFVDALQRIWNLHCVKEKKKRRYNAKKEPIVKPKLITPGQSISIFNRFLYHVESRRVT